MRTLKSSGVPEDKCRVGASACACCLWFVALVLGLSLSCMSGALGRRAFSCGPPLLLVGVMLSSQDPLVIKLSALS